ncbi:prepilin peptidase [Echinimonas agarilytica]|uniref:Prepilin leader peptidase/N-methyltransferase n=1 Tax=Echinimonas agarilytica TaxID=1215918 RepID=A0AA41W5H0_9GAMM|nr:A24 family peptidase [Echinimonas agarilytica]MCM2678793.1 A24 family peptidase [Echinimonas agarilytica]
MFFETIALLAQDNPYLIAALSFVFAALVGSFLNVVIYRLPIMQERAWRQEMAMANNETPQPLERFNLLVPASRCSHCNTQIKPWHNLPILGWFILGGKCASCQAPYSIRYPLIELMTAALSVLVLIHFDYSAYGFAVVLLTWFLICLTFIDVDHYLLPDPLNYMLLWGGLLTHIIWSPFTLTDGVIGAIAGYLSLWTIYWAFKLITGKEGMGYGDFKLLAAIGAWLGWQMLPLVILLSSLVGAVIGIAMIVLKGRDSQKPIPFGPYLAIAGWLALMWGDVILSQYLHMLGY